jgi:hypothetical protein
VVDFATGAISGTPSSVGVTVLAVKLIERDAMGNIIGTVMRDIQVQIIMCSNLPPTASPGSYTDTICTGEPFGIVINSTDADADEVYMEWGGEIAGAGFVISNNNSASPYPTGVFTWLPGPSDIGTHYFTVTVTDTACPINGSNTYTYSIMVIDCCDSLELGSCCEINLGNNSPYPTSQECDPCLTGGYPVWVIGMDGLPVDANDSDPLVVVEWLDESGTVIYTGWSFWATVDQHYTVRVTNTFTGCVWEDDFFYECCDSDFSFDIQMLNQTDPCTDPGLAFYIGAFDDAGNLLTDPPYTFDWSASDPTVLFGLSTTDPTLEAYVGVTYYLSITDSMGCVYQDTFEVDCCPPPGNLRCEYTSVEPTLIWDPVLGVTTYEVSIIINDPACCSSPASPPASIPLFYVSGTSYTLTMSYPCASFAVRSICGNQTSDWSDRECIDCSLGGGGGGRSHSNNQASIPYKDYFYVYPSPASDMVYIT